VYTYTIETEDFIMPADQASTIACAAQLVAPVAPTVTDNCGNALAPVGPVVSATPACEGNVTYTYTYTDCEGNTHDWVYTYTIETEDFTMPADQGATVECAAQITTPTLPVVVDNCGNVLTPSTPVITATPACEGTKIYTYTYTDCEGNTHDWTYTYTVDRITPPTVPANGTATVQCASDAIAPLGNGTINLIANGDFEAGLTGWTSTSTGSGASGWDINTSSPFPIISGTNNAVSRHFGPGINTFTTPIVLPSSITNLDLSWKDKIYSATNFQNPNQQYRVQLLNGTLGLISTIYSTNPSDPTFQFTTNTRSFNVTSLLSAFAGQTIYLRFETQASAPISVSLDDVSLLTSSVSTVPDVCGNPVPAVLASVVNTPSTVTCNGTIVYNYTYTDCSGLVSPWSYTYTIQHSTAPVVPANGASTVQCVSAAIAPTTPNVTDICGNAITPVLDATVDNPNPLTCEGTITYNYSYTDCAGLVTPWSYTYTIENLDFTMPADQGSIIACAAQLVAPVAPAVTDNCGNALAPVGPLVSATPA
jgi:hypothetical protein